LVTGMRMSGTYAEVTREAVLEHLDYLCYRTPTGKGWTANIIFRISTGSGRAVGNYNCFERDWDTCGLMLEALVLRLNELLVDPPEVAAPGWTDITNFGKLLADPPEAEDKNGKDLD